jgi:hypothetical protein
LDALILILLGRANSRIRKTCLLILIYSDKVFNVYIGRKDSSLLSIIIRMENRIIKDSLTAVSNDHMTPFAISDSVISGLEAVDFFEIACSNYLHLYRYYYGSLARCFSEFSDIRSICHINKYLHIIVMPRLHKHHTSMISLLNVSNALILLLAFGGAPVWFLYILSILGEFRGSIHKEISRRCHISSLL